MPSFDIVSEVDQHELSNAVDQANREVGTRFDFKGSNATFELKEFAINLVAQEDFQLKQMLEILQGKFAKRNLDVKCLEINEPVKSLHEARQVINVKNGIEKDIAKKITKLIKDSKIKVQSAIQGEQVRVTGKKRDDLQSVMTHLREANLDIPLQFNNFRD